MVKFCALQSNSNCTYDVLVESLGVSRSTVKRAIQKLIEQGKLERIGGKHYVTG